MELTGAKLLMSGLSGLVTQKIYSTPIFPGFLRLLSFASLPLKAFQVHMQWTPAAEFGCHRVELLFSNVFLPIFNCLVEKALLNHYQFIVLHPTIDAFRSIQEVLKQYVQ